MDLVKCILTTLSHSPGLIKFGLIRMGNLNQILILVS